MLEGQAPRVLQAFLRGTGALLNIRLLMEHSNKVEGQQLIQSLAIHSKVIGRPGAHGSNAVGAVSTYPFRNISGKAQRAATLWEHGTLLDACLRNPVRLSSETLGTAFQLDGSTRDWGRSFLALTKAYRTDEERQPSLCKVGGCPSWGSICDRAKDFRPLNVQPFLLHRDLKSGRHFQKSSW